jgi:hypothetical protein
MDTERAHSRRQRIRIDTKELGCATAPGDLPVERFNAVMMLSRSRFLKSSLLRMFDLKWVGAGRSNSAIPAGGSGRIRTAEIDSDLLSMLGPLMK